MDENRRKPFQFGMRDLLWGLLVVALIIGREVDRRRMRAAFDARLSALMEVQELKQEVRHLRDKHQDHEPFIPK